MIVWSSNVYTFGQTHALVDALPSFRAPSREQLFSPVRVSNCPIGYDPCDMDTIGRGPNPAGRLQNCQALFAANPGYGDLATFQDPAENTSLALISSGGNLNLKNEISKDRKSVV